MITSAHNRKIKDILLLNSKRPRRGVSKLFTLEGVKLFNETPKELIERVYVSSSFQKKYGVLLEGVDYEAVEDSVFNRICDTKTPQGILTVAKQPVYKREDLLGGLPFILILEDLMDPGNVGTIIRTAEGAGVTGIFLSKGCADVFSPKTIRSTMGSVFRVPFKYEEDLTDVIGHLKKNNIHVYGAYINGTRDYNSPRYSGGIAFCVGNESRGLSADIVKNCDTLLNIPMEGRLESLNAAVAASILMYTARGKRHANKCS